MKKPYKIITKEGLSKLVDGDIEFWAGVRRVFKTGIMPVNKSINNVTQMSCAKCFSVSRWTGKVEPENCPKCGCDNGDLVKVRYWSNGKPDCSVNLLKKK